MKVEWQQRELCFKLRARGEGDCENPLVLGSGKERDQNLYYEIVHVEKYCLPSTVGTGIICTKT